MSASDHARQAIAESIAIRFDDENMGAAAAKYALDAKMPDGRTLAEWLDEVDRLRSVIAAAIDACLWDGAWAAEQVLRRGLEADRG